jgi:hypothetical protein
MASEKQIAANRQNSKKSTGPKTEAGKQRSRQNAFRHGLTAQTVIRLVDSAEAYTDLETLIIADYEPQTTIERVLVERLASLLWRLRRAVTIETGLFQAQGRIADIKRVDQCGTAPDPLRVFRSLLNQNKPGLSKGAMAAGELSEPAIEIAPNKQGPTEPDQALELGRRFVRVANLDGEILERIMRYEVSLWRQAAETMLMLNSVQFGLKFYGRSSYRKFPPAWK